MALVDCSLVVRRTVKNPAHAKVDSWAIYRAQEKVTRLNDDFIQKLPHASRSSPHGACTDAIQTSLMTCSERLTHPGPSQAKMRLRCDHISSHDSLQVRLADAREWSSGGNIAFARRMRPMVQSISRCDGRTP
jgi:hypothetical protein